MKECIILAGGLGTRLRSSVPDLPKAMAPVAGKPFIDHVIAYLQKQGITRFIFSLGYMHEVIQEHIEDTYPGMDDVFSIEQEPLGTGGAIEAATAFAKDDDVLVVNGDTLFKADVKQLTAAHQQQHAACTLALKPMQNFERYGVVEIDNNNKITAFKEKQQYEEGLINGGVYVLNIKSLTQLDLPAKYSFESDYLEKYISEQTIIGVVQDAYFIDIGVPEDFDRANTELR
jgi:D-glycero-alpha-D-manno-heptose 1-phosphate guanylyltransferase